MAAIARPASWLESARTCSNFGEPFACCGDRSFERFLTLFVRFGEPAGSPSGANPLAGKRLGRPFAVRTLWKFSFRTAFGLGRGERAKLVPIAVLAFCFLRAFIPLAVASATGMSALINYA
jgi:hypothetical protein